MGDLRGKISWEKNWPSGNRHTTLIVDGAWKENKSSKNDPGDAAFGWVIREGSFETASGGKAIAARTPLQAEAFALLFGIKECHSRNIRNLEVWSDAKEVVESLKEEAKIALLIIRNIIFEIHLTLHDFESVCITKVVREKVQKAHLLANQARKKGM